MNTYVTEPSSLHHLHRSGFVVAPEMVEAHRVEAVRLNDLVDRMDDAYEHWTDRGRYRAATGSRRGAMREFVKVVEEFGGGLMAPVYASQWAEQRYRNRAEWAHAEAIGMDPEARELDIFRTEASRHLPGDELVRAVDTYADDLRKRDQDAAEGRCSCCGNAVMFNEPHGATCPLDEAALEEAAARVLALRSAADLDAR